MTYLSDCDNSSYTPASMNFETGTFSYGSWKKDEFFMPRPCMLKYDGTVDYYLDPNDYSKKADGTASDMANTSYAGNAMMEWAVAEILYGIKSNRLEINLIVVMYIFPINKSMIHITHGVSMEKINPEHMF